MSKLPLFLRLLLVGAAAILMVACQSAPSAFTAKTISLPGVDTATPLKLQGTPKVKPKELVELEVKLILSSKRELAAAGSLRTAILTEDEAGKFLKEQQVIRGTQVTEYPTVTTLDENEVVLQSLKNYPVPESSGSDIALMPVGTTLRFLPSVRKDGRISLQSRLVFSEVTGHEKINGFRYPIPISVVQQVQRVCRKGSSILIAGNDGKGKTLTTLVKVSLKPGPETVKLASR